MGQTSSYNKENYVPIEKRKKMMSAPALLNKMDAKYNSVAYNELITLIENQHMLEECLCHPDIISLDMIQTLAAKIRANKEVILEKTGIFVFPDIDKTPKDNVYAIKETPDNPYDKTEGYENMFLCKSNKNMYRNNQNISDIDRKIEYFHNAIHQHRNRHRTSDKYDPVLKNMSMHLHELEKTRNRLVERYTCQDNLNELNQIESELNKCKKNVFCREDKYVTRYVNKAKELSNNGCINSSLVIREEEEKTDEQSGTATQYPQCQVLADAKTKAEKDLASCKKTWSCREDPKKRALEAATKALEECNKEGFVASGGLGANYNKNMDTITGPSLFTNQILQNGTTWKDLTNTVSNKHIASDGPSSIGAGPGNNFDGSMAAHIRNMEIMQSANNEYNTPQMLKEINKNINKDISGGSNTALYNRGSQTRGKIITLNDKAVGVLPEEFYPERAKNRNIYKTQEIIPIAGFNINEARIGENLSEIHPVLYLQRSHRRMATGAGTTGNISEHVGKINAPKFDPKVGRTGNDRVSGPAAMSKKKEGFTSFDEGAMTGEDNFRGAFKAAEGGNYWMPKRFQY